MKAELYGNKIALEKKLDLYNKLNDILFEHYPFPNEERDTIELMHEITSSKLEELNEQYINLMNK